MGNPSGFDKDTAGLIRGKRASIPGADVNETMGHELLGHLWGQMFGGHQPGTKANLRDSVDAENAVRATDPDRGTKLTHHGQQVFTSAERRGMESQK